MQRCALMCHMPLFGGNVYKAIIIVIDTQKQYLGGWGMNHEGCAELPTSFMIIKD